jgi:hypothetical protein
MFAAAYAWVKCREPKHSAVARTGVVHHLARNSGISRDPPALDCREFTALALLSVHVLYAG